MFFVAISNSVEFGYTDDGDRYGARGGAVYNGGESSTILFNSVATFEDNVCYFVS